MSKKIDIELALKQGRYGELIRYLDQRIGVLSQAVAVLVKGKGKNPKGKGKKSCNSQ